MSITTYNVDTNGWFFTAQPGSIYKIVQDTKTLGWYDARTLSAAKIVLCKPMFSQPCGLVRHMPLAMDAQKMWLDGNLPSLVNMPIPKIVKLAKQRMEMAGDSDEHLVAFFTLTVVTGNIDDFLECELEYGRKNAKILPLSMWLTESDHIYFTDALHYIGQRDVDFVPVKGFIFIDRDNPTVLEKLRMLPKFTDHLLKVARAALQDQLLAKRIRAAMLRDKGDGMCSRLKQAWTPLPRKRVAEDLIITIANSPVVRLPASPKVMLDGNTLHQYFPACVVQKALRKVLSGRCPATERYIFFTMMAAVFGRDNAKKLFFFLAPKMRGGHSSVSDAQACNKAINREFRARPCERSACPLQLNRALCAKNFGLPDNTDFHGPVQLMQIKYESN